MEDRDGSGALPPIIALEGIDGSGKSVQFARLRARLEACGQRVGTLDFPCYDSFFGREIGRMLAGDRGRSAADVDARSMSLWYAMDRAAAFRRADLTRYDVVLLNRSTMANAAYQGSRIVSGSDAGSDAVSDASAGFETPESFVKWIFALEFTELRIPQPALFFIFDITPETSRANVAKKGNRAYVGERADVYERDLAFLAAVREGYRACADIFPGTVLLPCAREDGTMRPVEDIAQQVWDQVNHIIYGGAL